MRLAGPNRRRSEGDHMSARVRRFTTALNLALVQFSFTNDRRLCATVASNDGESDGEYAGPASIWIEINDAWRVRPRWRIQYTRASRVTLWEFEPVKDVVVRVHGDYVMRDYDPSTPNRLAFVIAFKINEAMCNTLTQTHTGGQSNGHKEG